MAYICSALTPKLSAGSVSVILGTEPLPERAIVKGFSSGSLLIICSVSLKSPLVLGSKCSVTSHVSTPPGKMALGRVTLPLLEELIPVILYTLPTSICEMFNTCVPMLLKVRTLSRPIPPAPSLRVGVNSRTKPSATSISASSKPVPLKEITSGLSSESLLTILRVSFTEPATSGSKRKVTFHVSSPLPAIKPPSLVRSIVPCLSLKTSVI